MNSIWLEHPEFPDYRISPEGNVLSLQQNEPRILKQHLNNNGYLKVVLQQNGIRTDTTAHRLVAKVYLARSSEKCEVNHKNGIKTDNRVENLEWVTKSENIRHAHLTGLKDAKHRQGEKSNFAKLTEDQAREILKELRKFPNVRGTAARLADKFNVSRGLITLLKQGKIWAHL